MIENLTNILNEDQLNQLIEAINANKDFKMNKDGLTIESKSGKNSYQISLSYDDSKNEKQLAKKESKEFQNLIQSMDDDLFINVCEVLGSNQIQTISDCLNSNKLETVRAGIVKFKNTLKNVLKNKINYYTKCLESYSK